MASPIEPVPAPGTRYYAIVELPHEDQARAMIASVNPPGGDWRQFRFDKAHKRWVEDPKVLAFLVGGETDALRARTLTDDQAAEILKGWGGALYTGEPGAHST